jgi:putative endonuclease
MFALSFSSWARGTFARMDRRELGRTGEDVAAAFLERKGWRIVARNVRTREGEIDLIAARAGVLAFVEVKTRRSRACGTPAEAVTFRKAQRIRRLAQRYLAEHRPRSAGVRFDVIDVLAEGAAFKITHLEGAF